MTNLKNTNNHLRQMSSRLAGIHDMSMTIWLECVDLFIEHGDTNPMIKFYGDIAPVLDNGKAKVRLWVREFLPCVVFVKHRGEYTMTINREWNAPRSVLGRGRETHILHSDRI